MENSIFAFPADRYGLGLLALRLAFAISTVNIAAAVKLDFWLAGMFYSAAALMLAGSRTKAASALGLVACAVLVTFGAVIPVMLPATLALQAIALALAGPGAYSLDGLLFGRQTIRLDE